MLHLVFQTPLTPALLERIGSADRIVLHGPAAWDALEGHQMNAAIIRLQEKQVFFYVLDEDLRVHGINSERLLPNIEVIDYQGLVDLTVTANRIQSWR